MQPRARAGIGILVGAAYAAVLLAFGLLAGVSGATNENVATEAEYRDALTNLSADNSGPHTINVMDDITITGSTDPEYSGTQPLTIDGNGWTIDAGGTRRVFNQFLSTAGLTLNDLTVANGMADSGGGIFTFGSVTLTNSTVTGNTASAGGGGGGVFASGAVTLTNSTVSGNTAGSGPGGGIAAGGQVTLTNSTVSGNTSAGNGGGMFVANSVTLTNSTVSGNTAAGASSGGIFANGSVLLTYATVVDNSASAGANLRGSGLTAFGSVVALPQGVGANCVVTGGTTSNGYNYSDDASCGFTGTGDTENGPDPDLGPLANNGGPTETRLPQTGSPLIDAIPVADCHEEVTVDQRGVTRPQDGDNDSTLACDIGAVEVEGSMDDGDGDGDGDEAPTADALEGDPSFTG